MKILIRSSLFQKLASSLAYKGWHLRRRERREAKLKRERKRRMLLPDERGVVSLKNDGML